MEETKQFYCSECQASVDAIVDETLVDGTTSYRCPNSKGEGYEHGFYDLKRIKEEDRGDMFYCPACQDMVPTSYSESGEFYYCRCIRSHDQNIEVGYYEPVEKQSESRQGKPDHYESRETVIETEQKPSFDKRLDRLSHRYENSVQQKGSWFKRIFGLEFISLALLIDRLLNRKQKEISVEDTPPSAEYEKRLPANAETLDPDTGEVVNPVDDSSPETGKGNDNTGDYDTDNDETSIGNVIREILED